MILLFWKGRLLPPQKATLSPLNTGLFYGESLFETIPVYKGFPLFLKDHLYRLKKGCHFLRWPFPSESQFKRAIRLFKGEVGTTRDFLIRFNLVQELKNSTNPRAFFSHPPVLFATIRPLRHDPDHFLPAQGKIGVSPWKSPDGETIPNSFKIPFYLTTRVVFRDHPEWNEFFRLNDRGYVVDGGSSTPMWFDGKKVFVPPLKFGGLESVTRRKILQLFNRLGIFAQERAWKPKDVFRGGELFFVGSGLGVMSASHLLGRKIKSPGFLAVRLWQHYRKWAAKGSFND